MKYTVLYGEDGRILALSRVPESSRDEAGVSTPLSGVEPGDRQRVAIVDVDAEWRETSPIDIAKHFVVVHEGEHARLKARRQSI